MTDDMSHDGILGELRAGMAARVAVESRLVDRMDEIAERLVRMETIATKAADRAEDVAKKLHDWRDEVARSGALNPGQIRAVLISDVRAMLDERDARLRLEQEKRDAALKAGAGFILSGVLAVGGALVWLSGWVMDHLPGLAAIAKMFKGSGQ